MKTKTRIILSMIFFTVIAFLSILFFSWLYLTFIGDKLGEKLGGFILLFVYTLLGMTAGIFLTASIMDIIKKEEG